MPARLDPQNAARRHQQVRKQNANELAQDYVEAIHELNAAGQRARVTDLQDIFGVSHVTVIRALQRFEKQGLLTRSRSRGIQLTAEGGQMAHAAAERHDLVVDFLRALGVSKNQANMDAEGIEHHLSKETIRALKRFLRQSKT